MITEPFKAIHMTKRKLLFDVLLVIGGILATCAILSAVGWIGHAHAQGTGSAVGSAVDSAIGSGSGSDAVVPPAPPADVSGLLGFLMTGKYLAAVGAGLMLVVGLLRNYVLGKVAWFQTQIGGYTLGWGVTTIIYVATALQAGSSITWALLGTAAAAGLAASGALNHVRDVSYKMSKPRIAPAITSTGVVLLAILTLGGCSWFRGSAEPAIDSAGKCEVGAVEQTVKADGISILADIIGAVMSGGDTLPTLLDHLIAEFGPDTIKCATLLANNLVPTLVPHASGSGATVANHPGVMALHSEIKKRGWE